MAILCIDARNSASEIRSFFQGKCSVLKPGQTLRVTENTFELTTQKKNIFRIPKTPKNKVFLKDYIFGTRKPLPPKSTQVISEALYHYNKDISHQETFLIYHLKGNKMAFTLSSAQQETSCRSVEFNELFHLMKKSKQKTFNASMLPKGLGQFIGTFIGDTYETYGLRTVVLSTRSDFLPSEEEEKLKAIKQFENYKFTILKNLITTSIQKKIKIEKEANKIISSTKYQKTDDFFHQERVKMIGDLFNTLNHEISNPLFGISLAKHLISTEGLDSDEIEILDSVVESAGRAQDIIKSTASLFHANESPGKLDLTQVLSHTTSLLKEKLKNIQLHIATCGQDNFFALGAKTWVAQVLFNIILNSIEELEKDEYQNSEKKIFITITNTPTPSYIISDSGRGIPQGVRERIFSNFFTTKSSGSGLGLGLCKRLLKKMNGEIVFKSNNGQDDQFIIKFSPYEEKDSYH